MPPDATDFAILLAAAGKLLDSVDFDNNGSMVGQVRTGGNGGLISMDTTRAADELRRILADANPPKPQEVRHG